MNRIKYALMGAALSMPVGIALGAAAAGIADCQREEIQLPPWPETVDTVVVMLSPEEYRDSLVVREVRAVNAAAKQELVSERLMLAVARVENRRADPLAVSSAGAVGLLQVHPPAWYGVFAHQCGIDLYDPEVNVCTGVRVMAYYMALHQDERLALAAYNGAITPWKADRYRTQVARALEGL